MNHFWGLASNIYFYSPDCMWLAILQTMHEWFSSLVMCYRLHPYLPNWHVAIIA